MLMYIVELTARPVGKGDHSTMAELKAKKNEAGVAEVLNSVADEKNGRMGTCPPRGSWSSSRRGMWPKVMGSGKDQ